jgi:hypothetical protein
MNDRSIDRSPVEKNECEQKKANASGNKKTKRNHVCQKNDEQIDELESLKRTQRPRNQKPDISRRKEKKDKCLLIR